MDETASDWEKNFASLQDFFGELVVYAEVCSFQLPAATLHLLFLLEVSEFGHNRTRPRGSRFLRSHPMDSFEADVFHGVFRKLQVCLDKVLTVASGSSSADSGMPENTRLSLMLRAWRSMTVSFIFLFSSLRWVIFSVRDLTESRRDAFSAASVSTCCWLNSSDSLRDLNSRCRISTRDNLASKLDNRCRLNPGCR